MKTISRTPTEHRLKQIRILEQKVRASQFGNPLLAQAYRKELKELKDLVGV